MELILYGAGFWGEQALAHFGEHNVFCFCDSKVKNEEEINLRGKKVISFQKLTEIYKENETIVIICVGEDYMTEIGKQLEEVGISDYLTYDILISMVKNVDVFIQQLQESIEREKIYKKYYKILVERKKEELEYLKSHVDIRTLTPAKGWLRKKQLKIVQLTSDFLDYFSELNISPFLTFGNLLGAYRHQGFIPWDDDMDLGIMRHEFNRLMEFAGKNCVVGTMCNETWIYESGEQEKTTFQNLLDKYPNKYVFNIISSLVQIFKKEEEGYFHVLDMWVYDFYKDECEISEHKKWIHKVEGKVKLLESEREKVELIREKCLKNPMISMTETKYFYPGIDNFGGYPGLKNVDSWILTKDVFPLKKVKYEDFEFWAPNNMEALLKHMYSGYMEFPYNLGRSLHGIWDKPMANEEE